MIVILICIISSVFAQRNENSDIIIALLSNSKKVNYCPDGTLFDRAETQAMYKGKELRKSTEFAELLKSKMSNDVKEGKVILYADIDCNGTIGNYAIAVNYPSDDDVIFCKSLINALNDTPAFTPAKQKGTPVSSKVQFKITYTNGLIKIY